MTVLLAMLAMSLLIVSLLSTQTSNSIKQVTLQHQKFDPACDVQKIIQDSVIKTNSVFIF